MTLQHHVAVADRPALLLDCVALLWNTRTQKLVSPLRESWAIRILSFQAWTSQNVSVPIRHGVGPLDTISISDMV